MTTESGRWVAASASVRGASHERNGKPNQDAVRVVAVDGPVAGLVAAVCDGHGGDRYVRSDVGARLGVEVACAVGRQALGELGSTPDRAAIESLLGGSVAATIVERWRDRVLEDVAARPFTDDERSRAGAALEDDPHVSYGCTLVLALLAPSWVGLLQIGDGDLTVVRGARAESPVPGDDRLVGGETTSLCLTTAVADARVHALMEPLPELVILTSDGYANSFASPNWRTEVGVDLRDHVGRIGLDEVESRLPAWLSDSAVAGGDDVTMALVLRVDALDHVGGAAVPSDRAVGIPTSTTPRRAGGAGRRRILGGLAVLLALLAGGAGGWALARADRAPAAPTVTTVPGAEGTDPNDIGADDDGPDVADTEDPADQSVPTTIAGPDTTLPAPTDPGTTTPPTDPDDSEVDDGNVDDTVVTATTLPVLTPADQVVLLVGTREGIIVAFDPEVAAPAIARSFGWVTLDGVTAPLPEGWTFERGELDWRGVSRVQAIAVVESERYVWAVGVDRRTLTSYDVTTGERSGSVTILDGEAGELEQADDHQPGQGS